MWIIAITLFCLVSAILIIRSAAKDADENTNSKTAEMYDNEISPESIQLRKAIKIANLRRKLNKIEKDRS